MLRDLRKPKDREGKITLSVRERNALLNALCERQDDFCAVCGKWMTRKPYHMNTATLGHDKPEPMGCAKRDNTDNLNKAICWQCNVNQGSKRL
jgi:hypothetical protein